MVKNKNKKARKRSMPRKKKIAKRRGISVSKRIRKNETKAIIVPASNKIKTIGREELIYRINLREETDEAILSYFIKQSPMFSESQACHIQVPVKGSQKINLRILKEPAELPLLPEKKVFSRPVLFSVFTGLVLSGALASMLYVFAVPMHSKNLTENILALTARINQIDTIDKATVGPGEPNEIILPDGELIQNTSSSLLNGVWDFIKWAFNSGCNAISSISIVQKLAASLMQLSVHLQFFLQSSMAE